MKIGDKFWYRSINSPGAWPQVGFYAGETSRSYLAAPRADSWYLRPDAMNTDRVVLRVYYNGSIDEARKKEARKIPKKTTEILAPENAELIIWARHHADDIANAVRGLQYGQPELLRKVADVIGWKERKS